jgi:hypothetical protein
MSTRKKPRHHRWRPAASASPSPDEAPERRRRQSRRWLALIATAVIAAAVLGGTAAFALFGREGARAPSAVIIDQLAATDANPAFVAETTSQLEAAGYDVDYIAGGDVSVKLFRELPRRGYDVIVVRNHVGQLERRAEPAIIDTGRARAIVPTIQTRFVSTFFTNQPFSRAEYRKEQSERLLGIATYPPPNDDGRQYFGVTPEFIAASGGDFDGAMVLLMGCGGKGSQAMAEAFLDKGAGSVVSWDELVTASHTDRAAGDFLARVLARGEAVPEAVEQTMATLGPDPTFGATLRAYE